LSLLAGCNSWTLPRVHEAVPRRERRCGGQLERDRAIGCDAVGDGEGQDDLCPIQLAAAEQGISLVDQVEDRADDQRDNEGAARHAVRNAAAANRDELRQIGEGKKITVVAWAMVARKGGKETCNCKLSAPKDTDNHIVLVDPAAENPTLDTDEDDSETAEFTPRVRLDHPKFTRENLEPLIDPDWKVHKKSEGKLLVRVTGLLLFDSEHFLRNHLHRHNNWEIHPVLKLEFCPEGETCRPDSDENWKDLESE